MEREKAQIHQIKVRPSWMDPIVLFLKDDILLEKKGEVNKVRRKAPRFWLFEDQKLYKCSFSIPYLLCIHPEAVEPLQKSYMKGFAKVIWEADHCLTGPSLRDIGGQICKREHKSM